MAMTSRADRYASTYQEFQREQQLPGGGSTRATSASAMNYCCGTVGFCHARAIRHQPYKDKVYNFHVEDLQCYAVGRNGVLVHNNSADEAAKLVNQAHDIQNEIDAWNKIF